MIKILVCGGGGFIGSHLVNKLKEIGFWVRAVDLKYPEFSKSQADDFYQCDLRDLKSCEDACKGIDTIFQLAADMGGAGFIFTGENDADIMHNSCQINLNILECCRKFGIKKVFYSSSACMYSSHNQEDPNSPLCSEDSAYPANPDSEYGWEKLFSERLYLAYMRNYGIKSHIVRYHNIFGPQGSWNNGREKAPAALCRKVVEAIDGSEIEIWGPGTQTRSFLYIDECIEGSLKLINSDFHGPVNIGSEEMIAINDLARMIIQISGKNLTIKNIEGPVGVMGRNSDNKLLREKLNWEPTQSLKIGIEKLYYWIELMYLNTKIIEEK